MGRELKCSKHATKDHVRGKPGVVGIGRNEGVSLKFKHINEKEIYDELRNLKRRKVRF